MKKSFKRLIIFSLIIIAISLLNGFVFKIFNRWTLLLFTIVLLLITKIVFGYEKDIILEIIINLITFFMIYYISGIFISFAKVGNYFTYKIYVDNNNTFNSLYNSKRIFKVYTNYQSWG